MMWGGGEVKDEGVGGGGLGGWGWGWRDGGKRVVGVCVGVCGCVWVYVSVCGCVWARAGVREKAEIIVVLARWSLSKNKYT